LRFHRGVKGLLMSSKTGSRRKRRNNNNKGREISKLCAGILHFGFPLITEERAEHYQSVPEVLTADRIHLLPERLKAIPDPQTRAKGGKESSFHRWDRVELCQKGIAVPSVKGYY